MDSLNTGQYGVQFYTCGLLVQNQAEKDIFVKKKAL